MRSLRSTRNGIEWSCLVLRATASRRELIARQPAQQQLRPALKSSTAPQLAIVQEPRAFGWVDGLVMLALLGLLWSALHFGKGMLMHFDPAAMPPVDSSPSLIPYYGLLGVECAAIFAIFTGQVWNMAFGFYHSMLTIPTDMQEAASTYGLTRRQRFRTVELPASAHSLIWNSMMSFGGGWFFVAQSEAISVMNKDIKLPGLGSYMALHRARRQQRGTVGSRRDDRAHPGQRPARVAPAAGLGRQVQDRADRVGDAGHIVGLQTAARRLPVHVDQRAGLAARDGQVVPGVQFGRSDAVPLEYHRQETALARSRHRDRDLDGVRSADAPRCRRRRIARCAHALDLRQHRLAGLPHRFAGRCHDSAGDESRTFDSPNWAGSSSRPIDCASARSSPSRSSSCGSSTSSSRCSRSTRRSTPTR